MKRSLFRKMAAADEAVSPIVGVMLMLVVTIIIAAVVSSFAGGLATDDVKAPSVNMECTVITTPVDRTGLLFEHKGGDEFELCDLKMHLQNRDTQITIDYNDKLSRKYDNKPNTLSTDIKLNGRYFQKICPRNGPVDKSIRPGDKFMFYADYYRDVDSPVDGMSPGFSWKPKGLNGGVAAMQNTLCEYKIIDKVSGQTVLTGEFIVP